MAFAEGQGWRRPARRWATLVAGWTLLVAGALLLVLPGPGVPLLLAGLALLGRELAWARRWRERAQAWIRARLSRRAPCHPASQDGR